MGLSLSLFVKVSCCLSNDIHFCLYLSTKVLNVFGAASSSSSKPSDSRDIGNTCSCLVHYGILKYPKFQLIHQNNLKMPCLPRNTSPNLH